MEAGKWQETFTETRVTYTLEKEGKFYLVQNVPARVSAQTGERLYSPDTVERLQKLLWAEGKPVRVILRRLCSSSLPDLSVEATVDIRRRT